MLVQLTVPFEEVFPELPRNIRTLVGLLRQLDRTTALIFTARLNRALSDPFEHKNDAKQYYAVSNFLLDEDAKRINQFMRAHGQRPEDIHVFTRAGCLELMRWISICCEDHPESECSLTGLDLLRTFGKAGLLASDLYQDRVLVGRLTSEGGSIRERRIRSMGALRQDVVDATYRVDPLRTMGRGRQLYRLLPDFFPDFEEQFQGKTDLTLREYYQCLVVLNGFYWAGSSSKKPDWNKALPILDIASFSKGLPAFERYVKLEAQTPDELCRNLWGAVQDVEEAIEHFNQFNLKPLRQRPLLRTLDGRLVILDPVFFAEKSSVGPLFHLVHGSRNVNAIFANFGKAVETYGQNVLKSMYPSAPGLVNRLATPLNGVAGKNKVEITDACLNDMIEIVLFEIKAMWIRDELVLEDDYSKFLDHLRAGYGKGVQQLATAITKLATGEWMPTEHDLSSAKRIYPVLVVYDPILTILPYTDFFANEFKKLLQPELAPEKGDMRKGRFSVTPLIIISIEMLENLETSVKDFALRDLLSHYVATISEPIISFNDFIAASGYKLRRNERLDDEFTDALEVLNDLLVELSAV